ncbi:MAG: hypothetical protein WCA57_14945, partial [Ilumatobacteraceae bacterium]
MRRFDARWVPLMIAAGAFVGSALVSSVAVANDEPPPIDQPELVVEPAAEAPPPAIPPSADPSPTDEGGVDTIDIAQGDDDMVSGEAPDPPFDDIAVIEMVMPDDEEVVEPVVETAAPDTEPVVETVAETDSTEPRLAETASHVATPGDPAAPTRALAPEAPPLADEPADGHEGGSEEGHDGGSGGHEGGSEEGHDGGSGGHE